MPVQQAGDQRGARHCTAFYSEEPSLEVDLSQFSTDLQVGTNVWFESATTRLDGVGRRTLRFRWRGSGTDNGTMWRHGTGAATELLRYDGAGNIAVFVNNVQRLAWRTGLWPSSGALARLAWVTMANPTTTGATDAMLSVLLIENETAGGYDGVWFTHPQKTATSATAYFGANDSIGTNAFGGTFQAIGYDRDVATLSVLEHDWGTVVADPSPGAEGMTVRQLPPLPRASGAGDAGEFFGLAAQWGGASHIRHRRRSLSPLVNERFPSVTSIRSFGNWDEWSEMPDGSGYRTHASLVRRRLVSLDTAVAWVRAHATVIEDSATPDVDVGIRIYSLDGDPLSDDVTDIRFAGEVVNTSEAASRHMIEDVLTLAIRDGHTWLALAVAFDPEGVAGSTTAVEVGLADWHVAQRDYVADDGGLGFGESS